MLVRMIEAAKRSQDIENKLTDNSEEMIDHLIKLFLFPNTQDTNHWSNELFSYIHSVPRLTTKGHHFPEYKIIMRGIWTSWKGTIDRRIKTVLNNYSKLIRSKLTDGEIEHKVYNYCDWLSKELSTKGYVNSEDIKEEVIELIKDIEVD